LIVAVAVDGDGDGDGVGGGGSRTTEMAETVKEVAETAQTEKIKRTDGEGTMFGVCIDLL
jgi:hypothetical protein